MYIAVYLDALIPRTRVVLRFSRDGSAATLVALFWRHAMNIVEIIEPMGEAVSVWSSFHVSSAEDSSGIAAFLSPAFEAIRGLFFFCFSIMTLHLR